MLRELHVKNIAVVAEASVELGDGLHALTGETGAGKSIVVDALLLLAGGRASTELIRTGAEALAVSGVFEPHGEAWRHRLEEAGLEAVGPELVVRREVSRSGRNRVFVNDQPATARLLAELAPELLHVHGQRDELALQESEQQREWLDLAGGAEARQLLAATAAAHERWSRLASRLEALSGDQRARRERLELLRFQASEIDAAALVAGEDDELRREREGLRHAEALRGALSGALALLLEDEEAAVARVARSQSLLAEIAGWEARAADWGRELESARIGLGEVARDVAARLDAIAADPGRLDAVEERLATIERLCRRFGAGSAEILARRAEIATEIDELDGSAADREELDKAVAAALADYRQAALALSAGRRRWGDELAKRVVRELADLALGKARFAVRLDHRRLAASPLEIAGERVEMGPAGIDQVVFELAANPGEEPGPLSRLASGGELSRISLALLLAVGGDGGAGQPTLVFDEVDSGIGGAQAAALGKKLQRLAAGRQILAVTHLPQVASFADLHYRIAKRQKAGRTFTEVTPLDAAARVEEVARMLAGSEVTDLSRSHAGELLANAARPA